MKILKRIGIALLILVILGFVAYRFMFYEKPFLSVLVFSKTEQFRHDAIEKGQEAIQELGKENGFNVDVTEDAAVFNEQELSKYNVIVFLNTTGDVLDNAQQLEFNRFIQAGGGFVGVHAAADTEYGWPWYGRLVGAYFDSHPNDPNVRDATITRIDAEHGSTAHLPEEWPCSDEWYNYRNISPDINVLLNLDESSYEGGTNGENHPIAWYQEFDGGRSWYTGRGHTRESYDNEDFLDHLLGGIMYAAGPQRQVNYNLANIAPEENRFTKIVLEDNLDEPMELTMLPDGKILFVQRHGEVRVFDPAVDSSTMIQKINCFSDIEDGLLGVALDPSFEENNWIYFFYSDPDEWVQNISRFTMADDYMSIDMESEQVLLTVATQREECCHSGGSMEFGPDGLLYISTGDNTNPHASGGYSPSDEREGRSAWDAQKSAANPNDLRGKILRIKPEPDGTYSIPEGNLFVDQEGTRPEIYVMGCRNPFRISVDQRTGDLYWGEVGPDAGEDSTGRGPRGHDEVNKATQAGFFGWPYFIGDNKPYNDFDFAAEVSGEQYKVNEPVNNSPNNTGIQNLPPAQKAFIWYPYGASPEFPQVGDGGRNAMAGPVFYVDDYPENDRRYPEFYDGHVFVYDWMRGWIMSVEMDEEGNFKRMTRFMPSHKFSNPTDMIFSPEGEMYLLEYGTVWFSQNPDARLVRIEYNGGNRKPQTVVKASKTVGASPMTVSLDGSGSIDFDGDQLTYEWYAGEGEPFSTEASPEYTFDQPGEYTLRLKVSDPSGEFSEGSIDFMVGNELPEIAWEFEGNRSFYWDNQSISYKVSVSDGEDGTLGNGIDPSQVLVSIDYLERGFDKNEIAMGHQAMKEASVFALGKRLMEGSDCSTCHQMDIQSVGPSYLKIAEKYKDDPNAESYLAKKIISGGGGVWGDIAMAAHPQLSESEASQMAKYILSLSGAAKPSGMATEGTYKLDKHSPGNTEGSYILTASYSDKGGNQIGSLTAQDVVVLRSPSMLASSYSKMEKAMRFTVDPEMSQGMVDREMDIVIGNDGGFVMYEGLDLTGVKALKAMIVKAGAFFEGGQITVHLDDIANEPVKTIPVEMKITDMGPSDVIVNLDGVDGIHDVFFKFNAEDGGAVTALINIYFSNVSLEENL